MCSVGEVVFPVKSEAIVVVVVVAKYKRLGVNTTKFKATASRIGWTKAAFSAIQ